MRFFIVRIEHSLPMKSQDGFSFASRPSYARTSKPPRLLAAKSQPPMHLGLLQAVPTNRTLAALAWAWTTQGPPLWGGFPCQSPSCATGWEWAWASPTAQDQECNPTFVRPRLPSTVRVLVRPSNQQRSSASRKKCPHSWLLSSTLHTNPLASLLAGSPRP